MASAPAQKSTSPTFCGRHPSSRHRFAVEQVQQSGDLPAARVPPRGSDSALGPLIPEVSCLLLLLPAPVLAFVFESFLWGQARCHF